MRKFSLCLLVLAALVGASTAWAGTVYVPLVVDQDQNGNRLETVIRVTNTSPSLDRSFSFLLIPANSDGTVRNDDDLTEVLLTPQSTFILQNLVANGQVGMVEISAASEISITARLEGTNTQSEAIVGAETPVITSDSVIPSGTSVALQGWSRSDLEQQTDFHFVNLGQSDTDCAITIYDGNGSTMLNGFNFTRPPLSLISFPDVLSLINITNRDEITAVINCNQSFYPFSTIHDLASGEVLFIPPSGSGRSTLLPPSEGPPVEPGATVLEVPGVFHVPRQGEESKRFNVAFPGNPRFSRIILDMDFVHGGWHPRSDENHGIFWLNRGLKWRNNLFGYLNVFGPGENKLKLSSNAGLGAGNIRAKTVGAALQPGSTYHVHFEYNVNTGTYFAEITENGQLVVVVSDRTTVNNINTTEENWFVDFGHERGAAGPEVPTYNWQYMNLLVQWIP